MAIYKIEQLLANKDIDIEEIGLGYNELKYLKGHRVNTIGDLLSVDKHELQKLDVEGCLSIQHIEECLYTFIAKAAQKFTSSVNSDFF